MPAWGVVGCFGPTILDTLLMGCGFFFCGVGVVEVSYWY